MTDVELLPHQHDFVTDIEHRYICMSAGYGAGKTFAFCMKAIHLASLNVGYTGILCEPVGPLIEDVLIPSLEDALEVCGIPYEHKKAPNHQFILHFAHGDTKIIFRSAENFSRLVGINAAFIGVDEVDTIRPSVARAMWKKLQGRLRKGEVFQMFCTSTPEGFKFMHEFFVKGPKTKPELEDKIRVIYASTYDNPTLPAEFIQDLEDNYSEEERDAYLRGMFVNLTSGRVYRKYDRTKNDSLLTIADIRNEYADKVDQWGRKIPLPELHIGMDFNIDKMAAVVHIIDSIGPVAIAEMMKLRDTEQMIEVIKERYPDFKINVYPDSSGDNRSHASAASLTDIQMLRKAGFKVYAPSHNGPVKDRVNNLNNIFVTPEGVRRYRINQRTCKEYVECLEQQVYDDFGTPDKKGGFDHANDAGGYFITYKFPIKQYHSGDIRLSGMY